MRFFMVFFLIVALSCPNAFAQTRDYLFHCKNEWMQLVQVSVPGESVDGARKTLKTDDTFRSQYTNCSYLMEAPKAKKSKKRSEDPS